MFYTLDPIQGFSRIYQAQGTLTKKSRRTHALVAAWLFLSILLIGLSFFVYSFILMSHGDINRDGIVDSKDTSILNTQNNLAVGDLNADGTVDADDLKILSLNWSDKTLLGRETPQASTAGPTKVIDKPIFYVQ